jgi:hypothetical protein
MSRLNLQTHSKLKVMLSHTTNYYVFYLTDAWLLASLCQHMSTPFNPEKQFVRLLGS